MRTSSPRSRSSPRPERSAPPAPALDRGGPVSSRAVRSAYGLTRKEFGRLSGFSERALASWDLGETEPSEQARLRLVELDRLYAALADVIAPDALSAWLATPNAAFDGLKPVEVVERGQIDRVWRMVFELESGNAA